MTRSGFILLGSICALAPLYCTWAWQQRGIAAGTDEFRLSPECPATWELNARGTCEFRNLYQLYDAPDGFGGLRVPLPKGREEFRPQQIDLGRLLFFDPLLSADGLSCAHCHHPDHGFSDGLPRSIGRGGTGWGPKRAGGVALRRGAPSLWNVGFLRRLTWDGHIETLEQQARVPLFSASEMALSPAALEASINANRIYVRLFGEAFEVSGGRWITTDLVVRALAAFESSLISLNSRYDQYAHGDEHALSSQEKRGLNLFRSFTLRCSQCHTPPLFTNGELAVIGVPQPNGQRFDLGAGELDPAPALRGSFRIPTLRNITNTAPYMHAGQYATLREVIDFYNDRRGHGVPAEVGLRIDWNIALTGKTLGAGEVDDLVSFLATLSDDSRMPAVPARVPSGMPVVGRESNLRN